MCLCSKGKPGNGQLTTEPHNFDRIACVYRWLEYATLGRTLERCRFHFLPQLNDRDRALVLGDGDGRFLAALLAQNAALKADAVDTSAAMIKLLRERCRRAAKDAESRLITHHTDALDFAAASVGSSYNLVVTHFFLDCLTQGEVESLATGLSPRLTPNALWLVSDFRIPGGLMNLPAQALVQSLYLAFRILADLHTERLPDHATALTRIGFTRMAHHYSLFGILTTELWGKPPG